MIKQQADQIEPPAKRAQIIQPDEAERTVSSSAHHDVAAKSSVQQTVVSSSVSAPAAAVAPTPATVAAPAVEPAVAPASAQAAVPVAALEGALAAAPDVEPNAEPDVASVAPDNVSGVDAGAGQNVAASLRKAMPRSKEEIDVRNARDDGSVADKDTAHSHSGAVTSGGSKLSVSASVYVNLFTHAEVAKAEFQSQQRALLLNERQQRASTQHAAKDDPSVQQFLAELTFSNYVKVCSQSTDPQQTSKSIIGILKAHSDIKIDTLLLKILDYEREDIDLRRLFDRIDDDAVDSQIIETITKLSVRNVLGDNSNQHWTISRATKLLSEDFAYAAGLLEAIFTKYEHQTNAFEKWKRNQFGVEMQTDANGARARDPDHFLTLIADSFFQRAVPAVPDATTPEQIKEDLAVLPQLLAWMTAARAAFANLNVLQYSIQHTMDGKAPCCSFHEFCKEIRTNALQDASGCGPNIAQTPMIIRYAADFFELILQEGVREPKRNMLPMVHLCELMASYYERCADITESKIPLTCLCLWWCGCSEENFVRHVLNWTTEPGAFGFLKIENFMHVLTLACCGRKRTTSDAGRRLRSAEQYKQASRRIGITVISGPTGTVSLSLPLIMLTSTIWTHYAGVLMAAVP